MTYEQAIAAKERLNEMDWVGSKYDVISLLCSESREVQIAASCGCFVSCTGGWMLQTPATKNVMAASGIKSGEVKASFVEEECSATDVGYYVETKTTEIRCGSY